jgi:hypothetical protein
MSLFNWGSTSVPEGATAVPVLNLKVGDTFITEVGVVSNGGVSYRNLSFDINWPVGVVGPLLAQNSLAYTVGDIFGNVPKDVIVNLVNNKVACSFTITESTSINSTGKILGITFEALAVGTGAIFLTDVNALDVDANGAMIQHTTQSDDAEFLVEQSEVEPPVTGTVLFYVNITK